MFLGNERGKKTKKIDSERDKRKIEQAKSIGVENLSGIDEDNALFYTTTKRSTISLCNMRWIEPNRLNSFVFFLIYLWFSNGQLWTVVVVVVISLLIIIRSTALHTWQPINVNFPIFLPDLHTSTINYRISLCFSRRQSGFLVFVDRILCVCVFGLHQKWFCMCCHIYYVSYVCCFHCSNMERYILSVTYSLGNENYEFLSDVRGINVYNSLFPLSEMEYHKLSGRNAWKLNEIRPL